MVSTGGSNKFFLLDPLIQLGDAPSVHLLQFVLDNVPEKNNLSFLKILKNQKNCGNFFVTEKSCHLSHPALYCVYHQVIIQSKLHF